MKTMKFDPYNPDNDLIIFDNVLLEYKDKLYKAVSNRALSGAKLEKNQFVLVKMSETFWDVVTIEGIGWGDKFEFANVKEAYEFFNVKSLKALEDCEYDGNEVTVATSSSDKIDFFYYLYEGRWSWGGGAQVVKFYLLEEYDERKEAIKLAQKQKEQRRKDVKYSLKVKEQSLLNLQKEIESLKLELESLNKV